MSENYLDSKEYKKFKANKLRYRKKRKSLGERLAEILVKEHGFVLQEPLSDWCVVRTHAGYWQRSSGSWSWSLDNKTNHQAIHSGNIGSQWSATVCLKYGFEIQHEGWFDEVLYPNLPDGWEKS